MKNALLSSVLAIAVPLCGCAQESSAPNTSGNTGMNNAKSIVVYFSATGTTKGVAERLAGAIGADVFEIVPK